MTKSCRPVTGMLRFFSGTDVGERRSEGKKEGWWLMIALKGENGNHH